MTYVVVAGRVTGSVGVVSIAVSVVVVHVVGTGTIGVVHVSVSVITLQDEKKKTEESIVSEMKVLQ